jgi:hypothetical protein
MNTATGFSGIIHLVESAFDASANATVETHCSGLANHLTNLQLISANHRLQSVSMSAGIGGMALSYLSTTKLAFGMKAAIGFLAGKRCVCPGIAFLHGETDEQNRNSTYGRQLVVFRDQTEAAIKVVTGQTHNIPFFLMQLSSTYQQGKPSMIAPQQLALSKEYPDKFVVCGPRYQYRYHDAQHFTNDGYRRQGELIAKVMWHVLHGRKWRPLSFRAVVRMEATIYVRFWVPVAPIVIDTTTVPASAVPGGKYGFEFVSSDHVSITNVEIFTVDMVKITLSSTSVDPPGAASICYARTPVGGHASGNVRDSDTTPSFYGYDSFNWAVHDGMVC